MTSAAALIALAAAAHLLPEHLARLLDQSQAAWESVLVGVESAVLWLAVGSSTTLVAAQAVAAWGALEGTMRAGCRLAFPMSGPPPRPPAGQNLCDIATGLPASWLSVAAALLVACIAQVSLERPAHVRIR
jgi:hypothetical protein